MWMSTSVLFAHESKSTLTLLSLVIFNSNVYIFVLDSFRRDSNVKHACLHIGAVYTAAPCPFFTSQEGLHNTRRLPFRRSQVFSKENMVTSHSRKSPRVNNKLDDGWIPASCFRIRVRAVAGVISNTCVCKGKETYCLSVCDINPPARMIHRAQSTKEGRGHGWMPARHRLERVETRSALRCGWMWSVEPVPKPSL